MKGATGLTKSLNPSLNFDGNAKAEEVTQESSKGERHGGGSYTPHIDILDFEGKFFGIE